MITINIRVLFRVSSAQFQTSNPILDTVFHSFPVLSKYIGSFLGPLSLSCIAYPLAQIFEKTNAPKLWTQYVSKYFL